MNPGVELSFDPLIVLALGLAVVGATTDMRARVIPNWLTVGAFVAALAIRALGPESFLAGLKGAGIAFGIGFVLYAARSIGAGDVKYLAAFGAVLGAGRIWPALLLVTVAAGVLAVASAMAAGRLWDLLRDSARLALYVGTLGSFGSRRILNDATMSGAVLLPVPLGVAIAAGCTLVWLV